MKLTPVSSLVLLLIGLTVPGISYAKEVPADVPMQQGLTVTEYPRQASQADDQNNFWLPVEGFGKPIGETKHAETLSPWTWNEDRNAIASGYLEVEADGDYAFNARSFYQRNLLMVDGQVVCEFRGGEEAVNTIALKKGRVKLLSAGFVGGRGGSGITIRWKPPGQEELGPIPPHLLLSPTVREAASPAPAPASVDKPAPAAKRGAGRVNQLITVADDFVVEVYRNGARIQDGKRELLNEIFGATVERMQVEVRAGDWLVFHVVNNRQRWGGVRYFAVAGLLGENEYGFVSDPASQDWSVCDDPGRAREFIKNREEGTDVRASAIAKPWAEGDEYMRRHAGEGYPGKALWGGASSTWIKYVAPRPLPAPVVGMAKETVEEIKEPGVPEVKATGNAIGQKDITAPAPACTPAPAPAPAAPKPLMTPTRWTVQVLSAIYGTGGKNADVTTKVKELVDDKRAFFAVNPPTLGADPNPYWNKSLWILYMKDGVRREQRRNENEHVLPESFYGPQDAAELARWLPASRWRAEVGEVQFHADHSLTGPGVEGAPTWEALGNSRFRITWSAEKKVEYQFDYTWSSFHEAENATVVYHGVQ